MRAAVACLLVLLWGAPADACGASYYSAGQRTASGARFRPSGRTIALRSHRFGDVYLVTYRGRSVVVVHDDFGPAAWTGRCADLSYGAARAIRMIRVGVADVDVRLLYRRR